MAPANAQELYRHPAVFLDRDDTLIACTQLPPPPPPGKRGDLVDPSLVQLLPGVHDGMRALQAAGFALVVVSNQGLVARGAGELETVERVNQAMRDQLGLPWLTCYYCPFHPQGSVPRWMGEHEWRKPGAGMFHAAAEDLALDLASSWMIGDAARDMEAAKAAGIPFEQCLRVKVPHESDDASGAGDFLWAVGKVLAGQQAMNTLVHAR